VPRDSRDGDFTREGEWFESSEKIVPQARVRYVKRQRSEKKFENIVTEARKYCKQRLPRQGRLVVETQYGGKKWRGMKYLEPSHVLDQEPTRKNIRYSQGREDFVDEMKERLGPGVTTVPRHRVKDGIWLTGWGQEPEVGRIRCQILSGQRADINLYRSQLLLGSCGWEYVDLFHAGLWEVMGVHSAGELIPIEGGEDSHVNRTFFKGIVKTTWRSR